MRVGEKSGKDVSSGQVPQRVASPYPAGELWSESPHSCPDLGVLGICNISTTMAKGSPGRGTRGSS